MTEARMPTPAYARLAALGLLFATGVAAAQQGPSPARYMDIPVGTRFVISISGEKTFELHAEIMAHTPRTSGKTITVRQRIMDKKQVVVEATQHWELDFEKVVQVSPNKRLIIIKGPLVKGQKWSHPAGQSTANYTVLDTKAQMKTPMREFSDVLVIEQKISRKETGEMRTLSYYAPGVGLIGLKTTGLHTLHGVMTSFTLPAKTR